MCQVTNNSTDKIKDKINKKMQIDTFFAYLFKAFKYMEDRNKGLYFSKLPLKDQESLLEDKEYLDLNNQYQEWFQQDPLPKLSKDALIILLRALIELRNSFHQITLTSKEILELTEEAFEKAPPLNS